LHPGGRHAYIDVLTAMEHHVNIRPIRTDQDHSAALAEIEACWGAHKIGEAWKIPADLLVRPYKIETAA